MIRPDAIPVRPLGSRVVLPPEAVGSLFGPSATLRTNAQCEVVRLGTVVATIPVEAGAPLDVRLDAVDAEAVGTRPGLRLRGPVGALTAPTPAPVQNRLVLPDALRRAWNVPEVATLGLGQFAVATSVASGPEAVAEVDRALWLAAGRPEAARWLPGVDLAPPAAPVRDDRTVTIDRRVVTETDVRQARLRRQRIRLGAGQIVTPAAQSLAREWGVIENPGG
ncbi:MAG: hypothetical protein AAF845_20280 [Bacteroidota bacterium]